MLVFARIQSRSQVINMIGQIVVDEHSGDGLRALRLVFCLYFSLN